MGAKVQLQVLVNHYNESDAIVSRFLASFEMQRGVDFQVLIFGDGGRELSQDLLSGFDLDIDYRYLPHGGMCSTRNRLLDAADADYVMFADIDDCMCSSDGLQCLMAIAEDSGADVIGSPYLVEGFVRGQYDYKVLRKDVIRVHGKAFRLGYLRDKGIRYPDEIQSSGDMMFLWLAYSLTDRIAWAHNVFYIWKHNPESLTRLDRNSTLSLYGDTLMTYETLMDELSRRGREDLRVRVVMMVFPMAYLDSIGPEWRAAPKELAERADSAIERFVIRHMAEYLAIDKDALRVAYESERRLKEHWDKSKTLDDLLSWLGNVAGKKSIATLT